MSTPISCVLLTSPPLLDSLCLSYVLDPSSELAPLISSFPEGTLSLENWKKQENRCEGRLSGSIAEQLQRAGMGPLEFGFENVDFDHRQVRISIEDLAIQTRWDLYGDSTCMVCLTGQVTKSRHTAIWPDLQDGQPILHLSTQNWILSDLVRVLNTANYFETGATQVIQFMQLPAEGNVRLRLIYDLNREVLGIFTSLAPQGWGQPDHDRVIFHSPHFVMCQDSFSPIRLNSSESQF